MSAELCPASLCRSGAGPGKDAFWSSALCGGMEQTPSESGFCVAASAFSNGSAGPWECLLKIRPERVLTTLIHGVIFWKCGVATDQRRHICECHGSERAHPGLAGSAAAAGAWAATGHSFPGAPLYIGRSRAGLSSSESTKHHEVLHHILAGDVKVFGSPTRHCVLRGGGCPRPPQALPGSIWAAATARMAAVILGKLAPAPAAGIRVQGGADVGTEFIRSAQVLEEVMSKCHAPCVATGGGGNQLPLNISRSQPAGLPVPTSLQPARAQPGLSPPCAPAASLAVQKVAQHPPAASVRVFALSCRQWDELGNGNGRACTKK